MNCTCKECRKASWNQKIEMVLVAVLALAGTVIALWLAR